MTNRRAEPRTLMQAHELLTSVRPSKQATPQTWLSFYRRSAALYAEIAEIDRGHHHEALYWANRERARAEEVVSEIGRLKAGQMDTAGGGS